MFCSKQYLYVMCFFLYRNPCRLKIEKLCVRHYPKVTDTFLMCVSKTCPNLEQIDVTGTSCTLEGIERYKTKRPNVKLVY